MVPLCAMFKQYKQGCFQIWKFRLRAVFWNWHFCQCIIIFISEIIAIWDIFRNFDNLCCSCRLRGWSLRSISSIIFSGKTDFAKSCKSNPILEVYHVYEMFIPNLNHDVNNYSQQTNRKQPYCSTIYQLSNDTIIHFRNTRLDL